MTRLQLPEADRPATEERLKRGAADAAAKRLPPQLEPVVAALRRYFDGEEVAFERVAIDLPDDLGATVRTIYAAARTIRWGETTTYGELARRVGAPGAARVVGQAMAKNPLPIIIPCHRVLASGGGLGGFSAYGGTIQKERLLVLERTRLPL